MSHEKKPSPKEISLDIIAAYKTALEHTLAGRHVDAAARYELAIQGYKNFVRKLNGECESKTEGPYTIFVEQLGKEGMDKLRETCANVLNELGNCYFGNQGTTIISDTNAANKMAFAFYRAAANLGNYYAAESLALCYDRGVGVERDIEEARVYKKLAEKLSGGSLRETLTSVSAVGASGPSSSTSAPASSVHLGAAVAAAASAFASGDSAAPATMVSGAASAPAFLAVYTGMVMGGSGSGRASPAWGDSDSDGTG